MFEERLASIRVFLQDTGDDAFLLTAREEIRWACGFSGSNGVLLVQQDGAALFTDGRYADQAGVEARGVLVEIVAGDLVGALGEHAIAASVASLAIDGESVSVGALRRIRAWPAEPQVHSYESPLGHYMAVKSAEEIECIRKAQRITDDVYEKILSLIVPGMTERELAAEIVYLHLRNGADGMSFEPIVASGPNGALPHARPTDRKLDAGDLVVMDFGCFADGYASDMTRTIGLGTPKPEALRVHAIVREAQSVAEKHARSGIRASDLDAMARAVIDAAGYSGTFTHSLGHGIGLRIHEAPRIAATNQEALPAGAVVTIEPGVYIPGRFGVRIENAVILHQSGCEVLPRSSTELVII